MPPGRHQYSVGEPILLRSEMRLKQSSPVFDNGCHHVDPQTWKHVSRDLVEVTQR